MSVRPLPLALAAACAGLFSMSQADARGFEVRDLVELDRVSGPALSPDGGTVVFQVREYDYEADEASTGLRVRNLRTRDLAPPRPLTPAGMDAHDAAFAPDGRSVYFLSSKSESSQVWMQPLDGGEPVQVTDYPLDVGTFKVSPDGRRLALTFDVFPACQADLACTQKKLDDEEARTATGVVYDQLFVRHWDTWNDGRRSQLFTAPLSDGKAGAPVLVSRGIDGDIPSKPFGGADDYAWAPDGASLAFSVRIAGRSEPWSTNFDIFTAPADGSVAPRNRTEANRAWDAAPAFSPDGGTLYYTAMERPGFEADRMVVMAMDLANGRTRAITADWDRSAGGVTVADDGRTLYTTADDVGTHPLFAIDAESGAVTPVIGDGSVGEFDVAAGTLAYTRTTLASPARLFVAQADGGGERRIDATNDDRLAAVDFGGYEQFEFAGWNGETVHGYVVKPWNYREGERYPVAFLIHGGPQGSFGDGWSYRWNPQTYAGQGYAVVMIDFHGSTGYGQAFTDSISQDWGGKPLEDLQKGWAAAQEKYAFLDGERACALGASYGGYMINWIAGNWNAPWQCLVNHDGVFDTRSMGYVTEELWFTEWENGGTPYEAPENYERFNPVAHVADWRVPMLVVQGEKDFRVPVDQGLSAFTALQRKGIESKLLYFPDENHWVLKPHNSVLWHDTVNAWLKQHIGQ
ncbi:alpha/beta hydrolase family protein [Coralloluteibacterium stylophorae]|uniref:S9 family peptidase n=1 Tax=Coralloluteibacterium stylophorae TaxID=1776034 RepID=A0A8J7VX97_9GAMM|nr:S9 family peptidase [Coralloluteibacterium stylophorae]MBS7456693.1 S9 family peptidase [Coralloluteibacterium stylophorae]